jgi:hypothetical protein
MALTETTAIKAAKKLHHQIISMYQGIWHARCSVINDLKLLFKDRIRLLSNQRPLHEWADDDYLEYAINLDQHILNQQQWKQPLSPTSTCPANTQSLTKSNGKTKSRENPHPPKKRKRAHPVGKDNHANPPADSQRQGHTRPIKTTSVRPRKQQRLQRKEGPTLDDRGRMKEERTRYNTQANSTDQEFSTNDPLFQDTFHISTVRGDGNCLFRAILRALGRSDTDHHSLRLKCVEHITSNWNEYANYVNWTHKTAPYFSSRQISTPFRTSADYAAYMDKDGTWASDVEALVAGKILQRAVLIWSTSTDCHGFLMNFQSSDNKLETLHLLHSTIHFDALLPPDAAVNAERTEALARQTCSSRPDSAVQYANTLPRQTVNGQQNELPHNDNRTQLKNEKPSDEAERTAKKRRLPDFELIGKMAAIRNQRQKRPKHSATQEPKSTNSLPRQTVTRQHNELPHDDNKSQP